MEGRKRVGWKDGRGQDGRKEEGRMEGRKRVGWKEGRKRVGWKEGRKRVGWKERRVSTFTVLIPITRVSYTELYQRKTYANYLSQYWDNYAKIMHTNNRQFFFQGHLCCRTTGSCYVQYTYSVQLSKNRATSNNKSPYCIVLHPTATVNTTQQQLTQLTWDQSAKGVRN